MKVCCGKISGVWWNLRRFNRIKHTKVRVGGTLRVWRSVRVLLYVIRCRFAYSCRGSFWTRFIIEDARDFITFHYFNTIHYLLIVELCSERVNRKHKFFFVDFRRLVLPKEKPYGRAMVTFELCIKKLLYVYVETNAHSYSPRSCTAGLTDELIARDPTRVHGTVRGVTRASPTKNE